MKENKKLLSKNIYIYYILTKINSKISKKKLIITLNIKD